MWRTAGALVAGYLTMALLVMLSFSALYLILGADRAFLPGGYEVSPIWMSLTTVLNAISAVSGGAVTGRISRDRWAPLVLAIGVGVVGMAFALASLDAPLPPDALLREGPVPAADAMRRARQPGAILILTPIIGALGIWAGGRWFSTNRR